MTTATPSIESFRTADRIVADLGDDEAAAKYNLRAQELEAEAREQNQLRDEYAQYLYDVYFVDDLDLKPAAHALLDKLIEDGVLNLSKDEEIDPDAAWDRLDHLDKTRAYRDADGDTIGFYPGENEWRWRDSSGDSGYSYDSHGPFKRAR